MLPALAGCWKRYPDKRSGSALLMCVQRFLSVFLVRGFVSKVGRWVTLWRIAINLNDLR
jgi:hypothetical protein